MAVISNVPLPKANTTRTDGYCYTGGLSGLMLPEQNTLISNHWQLYYINTLSDAFELEDQVRRRETRDISKHVYV